MPKHTKTTNKTTANGSKKAPAKGKGLSGRSVVEEALLQAKGTKPEAVTPDISDEQDIPLPEETAPRSWKVGVKTNGDSAWAYNGLRFSTKEAADAYGSDLFSRWTAVTETESHPSEDEPNDQPKEVEQPAAEVESDEDTRTTEDNVNGKIQQLSQALADMAVEEDKPDYSAKKTLSPLTREEFRESAGNVTVVIDGKTFSVSPKEFSSGSVGWFLSDKVTVKIAGKEVKVQVGLNLTVVGSKQLPR